MLKVGLTGGIATGKSYILGLLREAGCDVIDADAVARQVVEPGQPAFDDIVAHFGPGILTAEGALDRPKLGAIVFADAAEREKLNSIVHPRVYEAQAKWMAAVAARNPRAIAVVDAALMIETGSYRQFDNVIVVWCDPALQLERLMTRNGFNRDEAAARIAAQMPAEEKLAYADYSIDTSKGFEDTRRQVESLHAELLRLSAKPDLSFKLETLA
jgi:dephospho-CoA kinase